LYMCFTVSCSLDFDTLRRFIVHVHVGPDSKSRLLNHFARWIAGAHRTAIARG
jgi:hypothetical protein